MNWHPLSSRPIFLADSREVVGLFSYTCKTVEALYIQNFEDGMHDAQLRRLSEVLQQGSVWALNVGENFKLSADAWMGFAAALPLTHVTHMYVSEPHFGGITSNVKVQMRECIRANRMKDVRHKCVGNAAVIEEIGQMWWNVSAEQGIALLFACWYVRSSVSV